MIYGIPRRNLSRLLGPVRLADATGRYLRTMTGSTCRGCGDEIQGDDYELHVTEEDGVEQDVTVFCPTCHAKL